MKILSLFLFCMVISNELLAEPLPFYPLKTIKNNLVRKGYNFFTLMVKISHLIYPGTNFCGVGNVAERFDDLGDESQIDLCCRSHDYCKQYIEPEKKNFNLTNDGMFSSVSCECETVFNQCLKSAKTKHGNIIGNIYFNILGRTKRCFKKEYPRIRCLKYVMKYLNRRCVKFEYDTTKQKFYQWFNLPIYE